MEVSQFHIIRYACGVHETPQYANFDDFQGSQAFPFAKKHNGDRKFRSILDNSRAHRCQFGYFMMYLCIINHNKPIQTDFDFEIVLQNFELITDLVLQVNSSYHHYDSVEMRYFFALRPSIFPSKLQSHGTQIGWRLASSEK